MHIPKWLKRTVKWFFGTIVSLVLLISAALYIFHDEIVDYAIGEINKNLKAKVEVSKVDITFWKTFPNVSLDFHDVFIPDALPHATHADTLLYTEMIRMKFNPIDIWNEKYDVKSIEIHPGTLQLKVNKKGKVNYDIVKESKEAKASSFELTLQSIAASDLRFSYTNELQDQTYSTDFDQLYLRGKFTDKRFTMHTEAAFQIRKLQNGQIPIVINQPATTVVDIHIDKVKNTVSLPNGVLHLAGLPFQVSVFVDSNSVRAKLSATELPLTEVANHLSVKETEHLDRFKGKGTASFMLKVNSELGADAYPYIDCSFNIKDGKLVEPSQNLVISNLQLDGNYSTMKGKDKEELNLKKVAFRTAGGPFIGHLAIRKFSAPRYTGDAHGSVNLAVLHALFHLPKIETLAGNVNVDTRFALATVSDQAGEQTIEVEDGSGTAVLKQVSLKLLKDARKFEQINGKVILDQHEAALENLSVVLGRSDLKLNGHFDQIDKFLQDKSNLDVTVIAQSRLIDLADFNNNEESNGGVSEMNIRDWLLPTMINGDVRLDVGNITLGEHQFKEIHGNMTVGYRSIVIEQLFGRNAEASVQGTFAVVETAPEFFEMATNLNSKDLKFKPLFKEWNNFEQEVITSDNISGKAEVEMDFKAPFDMRNGILKDRIKSQIHLKVTNGKLTNVLAFKELMASLKTPKTRLVLKKREIEALEGKLNNIAFETLENTIYISNSNIIIPSMVINSSALDITTEGTHSFDNIVDYKFAFRLRDLKIARDESEFGEVVDDETGIRLYVRMYGSMYDPTIVWDGQSKKEQAKENREAAVQEARSILKSEFGLFKKDSTIKGYQPKIQPHEELRLNFDKEEVVDPVEEKKRTNKTIEKIKEKARKLKQQQEKDNEEEFIVN
ncbi:MAG: hypothetical protein A3D31_13380 [Candidatus Fluviicola riflensis]|nr:MAG: hypothetical protein CHH17_17815 [Candidatus Fluviicola riflensis]OGS77970.1 MAG: hypothetical protein A3D31_13380 [Candidatus Fluviicola riflensis]OGS85035.1 MAG: hypothetical protein A2724_10315 [Fluviicola sp. RIFCSPHIGHO2_01_FULL_43_53]OGS89307.1 MAG: hypothetical protein A3E30_04620 [Fluviicola sp. RIFCSPHIGHO2_12_FULL_43_24]